MNRARICKCLWSPRTDSEESIPPAYVAWCAGTTNRFCRIGPLGWESIPGLLKRFTNTGSGACLMLAQSLQTTELSRLALFKS
jgi:hypothetical protein